MRLGKILICSDLAEPAVVLDGYFKGFAKPLWIKRLPKIAKLNRSALPNFDEDPLKKYNFNTNNPSMLASENDIISVLSEGVSTEEHRETGALYAGLQIWHRLGIDSVLQALGLNPQQ